MKLADRARAGCGAAQSNIVIKGGEVRQPGAHRRLRVAFAARVSIVGRVL